MQNGLVSIIIPCYNGEKTIGRALQGVVNQTYRPLQLIVVNDGSTDQSQLIIESYCEKIENAGILLDVINQENRGLGGAINSGLKLIQGEFFTWADADDELLPASVEKRVSFLKNNSDYGSVSSDAYYVEEDNWNSPIGTVCYNKTVNEEEWQFENMLQGKSLFCSGCHLVRTDMFCKANNGMEIYPARHGQNWQLLLPIYYTSKHGFLNEPLYKYGAVQDSMSSLFEKGSASAIYHRRNEYLSCVKYTLKRINTMTKKQYKKYWRMYKGYVYDSNLDLAIERKKRIDYIYWRMKRLFELGY